MKTKKIIGSLFLALIIISNTINAQEIIKNEYNLPEFNTIQLLGKIDATLTQSENHMISIEKDNIKDSISYEVKNGTLVIRPIKSSPSSTIKVAIFSKAINGVELMGASTLKTTNTLNADLLDCKLSGATSSVLNINCKKLNVTLSGASDLELEGFAEEANYLATGASDIDAKKLKSKTGSVIASGSCDVDVDISDKISLTASGASDISYAGTPQLIEQNVTGESDISGKSDTTKLKIGKNRIMVYDEEDDEDDINDESDDSTSITIKPKQKIYWSGITLGVNGYLDRNNTTEIPVGNDFLSLNYGKSFNVQFNFFEQGIRLVKGHVALVTGLGFDFTNYRFDNNYTLTKGNTSIGAYIDSSAIFSKNKLAVVYLNAPLMLQFDTKRFKNKKTLHCSFGVVGGMRLTSHVKQAYISDNKEYKDKIRDDFNLAPFRYSGIAKIGYGNLEIFAMYTPSELFKKHEGPQVYPFTVGITLVGM